MLIQGWRTWHISWIKINGVGLFVMDRSMHVSAFHWLFSFWQTRCFCKNSMQTKLHMHFLAMLVSPLPAVCPRATPHCHLLLLYVPAATAGINCFAPQLQNEGFCHPFTSPACMWTRPLHCHAMCSCCCHVLCWLCSCLCQRCWIDYHHISFTMVWVHTPSPFSPPCCISFNPISTCKYLVLLYI